jgi:HEAT repeats
MPTENERKVLNLLSVVDLAPGVDPGKLIQSWGNEAVTVACEAALGSYAGLQRKVRTNAVAVLETIDQPQARETVRLLVKDPDSDVQIRALRAAAGQKNAEVVADLSKMLQSAVLAPVIAAEVVKALQAIDSPQARQTLQDYEAADATQLPHRGAAVVSGYLRKT